MLVGHGNLGFAQQPAEPGHALFAADVVRVGFEHVILQHGAVAAKHNLGVRRVFPDQGDQLLHLVDDRHDERDAHVIVALLELAEEFGAGRVLQHHRRGIEVFGNVIKPELDIHRARAKHALHAGHLAIEQFVTDGRRIAVFRPQRAANTGQQNFFHGHKI